MIDFNAAVEKAAGMLTSAESGYAHRYGSVPLETRMELADRWITLTKILKEEPNSDS